MIRPVQHSRVTRATEPTDTTIISLDLARKHLRQEDDTDDDLLAIQLAAARQTVEQRTGISMAQNVHTFYIDRYPLPEENMTVIIPVWPVTGVTEVAIWPDGGSDWQVLTAADYYTVDSVSKPCKIRFIDTEPLEVDKEMPIRIKVTAGYTEATVPARLKQAILLILGHMDWNREEVVTGTITSELPDGAKQICLDEQVIFWTQ